jgi:glycosidase
MRDYPDDAELQRITLEQIQLKSRDNSRTPMQWSNTKYAGFSTAAPWQAENPSYKTINAASQVGVQGSVFEHWASILRLRKSHKDVFIYGDFEMVDEKNNDVFAYTRSFGKEKALVVANFRKEHINWEIPTGLDVGVGQLLTSNYETLNVKDGKVDLRPFESFAIFVK